VYIQASHAVMLGNSKMNIKFHRRNFLRLGAGALALPVLSHIAAAQAYPSRPARILVGFPPGGTNDIHARLVGQLLSERLGKQFIVENRAGAGGNLATEALVRAEPDGYTLLLASATDSWSAALYDNLKFDFIRDVSPVASIDRGPGILVAHPSFAISTVRELIAYAKANPGKVTVASSGIGSGPHIYWELFKSMASVNMLHVPYRGGGPALTDLLAGQVQVMFATLASAIEYVRSGRLRALGVTAEQRLEALPNVPAIGEFVPGYEASGWMGIVAPKNTPAEIVDKLNREINAELADPKMKTRIKDLGSTVFANSPADFGRFIVQYTEKWKKVIRTANIRTE
jgi:tripartite-type tricarboxylate transporter receptor subunit TctC